MPGSSIANSLEEKICVYREQNLTGIVRVSSCKSQWLAYYLNGQIVWTKSRAHATRRWLRQLAIYSPTLFEKATQSQGSFSYKSCNYDALARLVKLKQFHSERFFTIVESCIAEDLFDILQAGTAQYSHSKHVLRYEVYDKEAANLPFLRIHRDLAWQRARQEWQEWEQAGLAEFSPDWAPVITQPEVLKQQTSPQTFQTLTTSLDGNNTLRDLAIEFKGSIVSIAKSLLPYMHKQVLAFTRVSDPPNQINGAALLETPSGSKLVRSNAPRIVYIDDSPTDSQLMSEIIENLGCQYTNISDPIQALPILIELKPKLIFLDLVMPVANGYEVCSQIRRISTLKDTPVIIVTSNDGIIDRVRARIVGASGFLGKPIHLKKVEKVMKKHLIYEHL